MKAKKSIPKWQSKLTAAERSHLRDSTNGTVTLEGLKRNLAGQAADGSDCWDCHFIAKKLGLR